jgi:hypothetical protein
VEEVLERSSLKATTAQGGVSEQKQQKQQSMAGGVVRANRLSFHEQDVHIIPIVSAAGQQATPGGDEAPATGSSAAALEDGSLAADEDAGKEKRKSLLQSLQSMMGGGSFRTDFTLGQRSLSNTINIRCVRTYVRTYETCGCILTETSITLTDWINPSHPPTAARAPRWTCPSSRPARTTRGPSAA